MKNEGLQEGVYEIPKGYKAAIRGGKVEVAREQPKPSRPDDLRCADCAHCGSGQTFYSQDSEYYGLVCFARIKKRMIREGKVIGNLYYSVTGNRKKCELFKRRKRMEKDH